MKKVCLKVVIITIRLLGIVNFTNVSNSISTYYDTKEYAIIYQNGLAQLNKGSIEGTLVKASSTKDTIQVRFNFNRNSISLNENDKYLFSAPANCKLSSNEAITSDNTISYSNNYLEIPTINIDVTCPIDAVTKTSRIIISLDIKEQINDEDIFSYYSGSFSMQRVNYDNLFPNTTESSFEISEDNLSNLYDELIDWIIKNNPSYSSSTINDIKYYLEEYKQVPAKNVLDIDILGINVTYDADNKIYHFELTNNFVGYAITYYRVYYERIPNNLEPNIMYFSTKYNIKSIFEYYIEKYFYPKEKDALELIEQYFKNHNVNIEDFILNTNGDSAKYDVPGITWLNNDDSNFNSIRVDDLLEYAKNDNLSLITVKKGTRGNMAGSLTTKMKRTYYKIFYDSVKNNLLNTNSAIVKSIIKNNTSSTVGDFNDYFFVLNVNSKDEEEDKSKPKYLLVNIYSNEENENTYFDTVNLDLDKENIKIDEIKFTNGDETTFTSEKELSDLEKKQLLEISLKVNISDESEVTKAKEDIIKFIKLLNDGNENDILKIDGKIYNGTGYGILENDFVIDSESVSLTFRVNKLISE